MRNSARIKLRLHALHRRGISFGELHLPPSRFFRSHSSCLPRAAKMPENLHEQNGTSAIEYAFSDLPLELIHSQKIPPSPNRSPSAIDFLHDFAGISWIAFGASSLLVISHFPSPRSQPEVLNGAVFRQVIEPPCGGNGPTTVKAVAWSPLRPSDGEIAVASENRICLYSAHSGSVTGSSFWKQTAGLLQSSMVEALKWTGSGDGLVAVGIEVVFWRRKNKSWEVAWKLKTKVPQSLVSATWSIEGPAATAVQTLLGSDGSCAGESSSLNGEASKCVSVYQGDGGSGLAKVDLCHPQPVSMIHWRPSTIPPSKKENSYSWRDMLLTCCLDGTVRLWCEIDCGRTRKSNKYTADQKATSISFHVAAVIEINQSLNGTLGGDTFVTWAIEIGDPIHQTATEGFENDTVGRCEWLIGFGPDASVTFWAIHCLDDISPLRFPRVTLWKKQSVLDSKAGHLYNTGKLNIDNQPLLVKAFISRKRSFGPPSTCSWLQLLPDNSISWSLLYSPSSSSEVPSDKVNNENSLLSLAENILSLDGPSGNILQVAVHPYSCEIELAVSLDSNGFLLFWLLPTFSSCILSMPALSHPTWKLLGRISTQDVSNSTPYSTLKWAPSILNEKRLLLVGHLEGIDCLIIEISDSNGDKIRYHKICTIPFLGHNCESGPDHIFATSLSPTCSQSFVPNSFMLFSVWVKDFQALSWKVAIHSDDLHGSNCGCGFDAGSVQAARAWRYESRFDDRMYYLTAQPCASKIPDPHSHNQVTAVAIVSPENFIPSIKQKSASSYDFCSGFPVYNMVTGCSDGSLKLWRVSPAAFLAPTSKHVVTPWELVGMFTAHQGPVSGISLSSSGSKIATIISEVSGSVSTLHIWEPVHLVGSGSVFLEDTIAFNEVVVSFDWLAVGNGWQYLGVCLQNGLRIYAQNRFDVQSEVKSEKRSKMKIWSCIAFCCTSPPSQGFLWGPRSTLVLVHDAYFSLFSQWSASTDGKHRAKFYHEINEDALCAIYTDLDLCDVKEPSKDRKCESLPPADTFEKNYYGFCNFCSTLSQRQYEYGNKNVLHNILQVGEKLCGALPIYHPDVLIQYLYTGNWKRAYVAVKHLVNCLHPDETAVTRDKDNHCGSFSQAIPQIQLSLYFGEFSTTSAHHKGLKWGGDPSLEISSSQLERSLFQLVEDKSVANNALNLHVSSSGKFDVSGFVRVLEKSNTTKALSDVEKIRILAVIDILGEICDSHYASAYEGFDEPGRRYLGFGLQYDFNNNVFSGNLGAWLQQKTQEQEVESAKRVEREWKGEVMRGGRGRISKGSSKETLDMEKLARLQYLKKKDPKDCALLYLALNRHQVLTGLFKISKDEKDRPLVGFLSRNFQEGKNKAAALKNAYVLMGKHQLELAIAFFLLGGDPSSAVSICAKNLGDEQLALVICRLVEGYGGPLERHLISSFLLPNAIQKGDFWLASLLEHLLGFGMDSSINNLAHTISHVGFTEPSIGQYCLLISSNNSVKNSVGEYTTTMLARLATWMTASALNRCGLPLEALESLSSASSTIDNKDQDGVSDIGRLGALHQILNPSMLESPNWLLEDITCHLEYHAKLNLAMQYISKLMVEHPSWLSSGAHACSMEFDAHQYELSTTKVEQMLKMGLTILVQKYSLQLVDLMKMLFLKASEEAFCLLVHYIFACSIACSALRVELPVKNISYDGGSVQLHPWDLYLQDALWSLGSLRTLLKLYGSSFCTGAENYLAKSFAALDLLEYCLHVSSACSQMNCKGVFLATTPILLALRAGRSPSEIKLADLMSSLQKTAQSTVHETCGVFEVKNSTANAKQQQHRRDKSVTLPIPEDEKWKLIIVCLWQYLSAICNSHLNALIQDIEDGCSFSPPGCEGSPFPSTSASCQSDINSFLEPVKLFPAQLANFMKNILGLVTAFHAKQLISFLVHKVEKGLSAPSLVLLGASNQSEHQPLLDLPNQGVDSLHVNGENGADFFEMLWEICFDPMVIHEIFAQEKLLFLAIAQKPVKCWSDVYEDISNEYENGDATHADQVGSSSSAVSETGLPAKTRTSDNSFLVTGRKDSSLPDDITFFQNPKEIHKQNGELLEAMCINAVNQQEVALASSRKGLMFFTLKSKEPFWEPAEYIWSDLDWPKNEWAGSESTSAPTFVSSGIGVGGKQGAHLRLGGATIGRGSSARPGKDYTGGGAFGIPGYAGVGASGLGWGGLDDLDEYVDPPATIENIRTRSLSSHPSRPFFLVGSSNTHVYLWEFGKDGATATYGVLPAANVPPPYALASISALQFDRCGHRFATAALDGTLCTWQLEVGGRSNVQPTESSLCFNKYALDVAHVAASGSILAATGYSSNNASLVIWDTLAPPASSRASVLCHEGKVFPSNDQTRTPLALVEEEEIIQALLLRGGARSLSVFDNDIGSGSVSPLIVTGGKSGDVGLHDLRYIATGRTKRHRHRNPSEQNVKSGSTQETHPGTSTKFGEQNRHGMLWHIPKAHQGPVFTADYNLMVLKQAAVTDIVVLSHGFLTCGGDGSVRMVQLRIGDNFLGDSGKDFMELRWLSLSTVTIVPLELHCRYELSRFSPLQTMAASEARAACQKVANCCFIQEDAKKASKLAHCLSSSSTFLPENASVIDRASRPYDPTTKFIHINWNPSNPNLQPGTRWWLQLHSSFSCRKNMRCEGQDASEAELKQMIIGDADLAEVERNSYSSLGSNWMVLACCTKDGSDARLQELRMVKKQMLQPFRPNVDMDKYRCWGAEFMDAKIDDGWISDRTMLIGCERIEGKRLAMERNELDAIAALKSTEKIENCDLPQSKTIHVSKAKTPFDYQENRDCRSIITSTLDQKIHSKLCRSNIHVLANSRDLLSNEMRGPLYDSKGFPSSTHTSSTAIKDSTGTEASKLSQLMEALCHSQTRAREAEKAAQQAYTEKEHLVTLFFQQAYHLFACKQWLQVLQLQNNLLQLKLAATKEEQQHRLSQSFHWMPSRNPKWWQKPKDHKIKRRKLGQMEYKIGENVVAAVVGLSLIGAGMFSG
ncbi:hypothetical protein ACLOJK_009845 [Asimina triloba]